MGGKLADAFERHEREIQGIIPVYPGHHIEDGDRGYQSWTRYGGGVIRSGWKATVDEAVADMEQKVKALLTDG
jgi:hypothetical protein